MAMEAKLHKLQAERALKRPAGNTDDGEVAPSTKRTKSIRPNSQMVETADDEIYYTSMYGGWHDDHQPASPVTVETADDETYTNMYGGWHDDHQAASPVTINSPSNSAIDTSDTEAMLIADSGMETDTKADDAMSISTNGCSPMILDRDTPLGVLQPLQKYSNPSHTYTYGACLPDRIMEYIFEFTLGQHQEIKPLYQSGRLRWGMLTQNPLNPDIITEDNVDLALLRLNKAVNQKCSELFYGSNTFLFSEPEICEWWIKHIGKQNFGNIRTLSLVLSSHFEFRPKRRNFLAKCREEVWIHVIDWLLHRHQLDKLFIYFNQWIPVLNDCTIPIQEKALIQSLRLQVVDKLKELRGISEIVIDNIDCNYFSRRDAKALSSLMCQSRLPQPPIRQLSLTALFEACRIERELREEEEEDYWG